MKWEVIFVDKNPFTPRGFIRKGIIEGDTEEEVRKKAQPYIDSLGMRIKEIYLYRG